LRKVALKFPSHEAKEVYLVGRFNNWDTQANLMKRDRTGLWKTALSLKPGRYEYRFLVDSIWMSDISCYGCLPIRLFPSESLRSIAIFFTRLFASFDC